MKTIFLRPIGTVRGLGTRREWLRDAAGVALVATALILALILL
jgi:hypothetical protein